MTSHRVKGLAVSALLAVLTACGSNGAQTSTVAPPTASAAMLVPYVALTPDATPYVAVDPALTVLAPTTTTPSAGGICSVAPSSTSGSSLLTMATSGTGEFAVQMVDAPNPIVNDIWITVQSVSAHVVGQGWIPLAGWDTPKMFDLLKLTDGNIADLGFASLPAGAQVTQIRLLLADQWVTGNPTTWPQYVVLADASSKSGLTTVQLKVPSGYETGIKIIGPWTIAGCTRTTVTIDFDGKKSLWYHPNGPETEWILRPVVHAKGTSLSDLPCSSDAAVGGTTTATTTAIAPVDSTTSPTSPGTTTTPTDTTTSTTSPGTTTTPTETTTSTTSSGTTTAPDTTTSTTSSGTTTAPTDTTTSTTSSGGTTTAPADTTTSPSTTTITSGTTTLTCTASGTVTTGSVPPGGSCSAPSECTSGSCVLNVCTLAGAGQTCSLGAECTSGTCNAGSCAVSGVGQSCSRNGDCSSGLCVSGTCAPSSNGLPTGATCSVPAECASGSCYQGGCLGGLTGQPCTTSTDCVAGLRCVQTSYTTTNICLLPMAQ